MGNVEVRLWYLKEVQPLVHQLARIEIPRIVSKILGLGETDVEVFPLEAVFSSHIGTSFSISIDAPLTTYREALIGELSNQILAEMTEVI